MIKNEGTSFLSLRDVLTGINGHTDIMLTTESARENDFPRSKEGTVSAEKALSE